MPRLLIQQLVMLTVIVSLVALMLTVGRQFAEECQDDGGTLQIYGRHAVCEPDD